MATITVPLVRGVFTHANPEYISEEYATKLVNLRSVNGKLVKTFGKGEYQNVGAFDGLIDNAFVFIHEKFASGFIVVTVTIHPETNVATFWYWNGTEWRNLADDYDITGAPFYHRAGRNPIVADGNILRILPGNIGNADGAGLWFGYINRKRFDELVTTTAGFYGCLATCEAPDLTIESTMIDQPTGAGPYGTTGKEQRFYKFSYVYDGGQESLLSDVHACVFENSQFPKFTFSMPKTLNARITAIRVYRATTSNGTTADDNNVPYSLIHTIDFLRETGEVLSGSGSGLVDTNGCLDGRFAAYIPSLMGRVLAIAFSWRLKIGNTTLTIPNGTLGNDVFIFLSESGFSEELWNAEWELQYDDPVLGWTTIESHETGLFAGPNVGIITAETGVNNCAGGIFEFMHSSANMFRLINKNHGKAISFTGDDLDYVVSTIQTPDKTARGWMVLSPSKGLFAFAENGDNIDVVFYDTGESVLSNGAEYPLSGEKYIRVNGEFARVISGRLWQGNVILDPGGKNEERTDWVTYSELNQLDVTPVSNAIRIADREGGPIMGIAELFGCPVILKRQAIVFINIRASLSDPTQWSVKESAHNIGCIAKQGYIEVAGDLYVPWHDGIYRLSANNLAETDATPTERLRITDKIEDVYQALNITDKGAIKATYNTATSEIVWTLGIEEWAYSIVSEEWRRIGSDVSADLFATDENGQGLAWSAVNGEFYSFDEREDTEIALRTKWFRISDIRDEVVRYFRIPYVSEDALALNVYVNGSLDTEKTVTLPPQDTMDIYKTYLCVRAKTVMFEIIGASGKSDVEIGRIEVEYDQKGN